MENLVKLVYDLKDKRISIPDEDSLVFLGKCMSFFNKTNSQNFQDVFALHTRKLHGPGVFVEFGACDGIEGSNTLMLERDFGWAGCLAEPNPAWHEKLFASNRVISQICADCVWTKSDAVLMFDATERQQLATIAGYGMDDEHAEHRKFSNQIFVKTISLLDFLHSYSISSIIDYMSVDTEGSEYDILEQFFKDNKGQFKINAMSIEHNYMPIREKIHALMIENGYERKYEFMSRWDDYYVKKDI